MALSDRQVFELAKRMDVPLIFCDFKDNLRKKKLQYNKSYIINMEDEIDKETGQRNEGSHYTCFQVNKFPNGKTMGVYFDSYGMPPPKAVEEYVKIKLPHNNKQIQGRLNNACGWFCLAFLHFINSSEHRSRHLPSDCENFCEMFDDLANDETTHLKNEYILKHFFRSKDPALRKPIEVGSGVTINTNTITSEDTKE